MLLDGCWLRSVALSVSGSPVRAARRCSRASTQPLKLTRREGGTVSAPPLLQKNCRDPFRFRPPNGTRPRRSSSARRSQIMTITFLGEYERGFDNNSFKFTVRTDGKRGICRIAEETLADCFASAESREAYKRAFLANRDLIEATAAEKILRGDVNTTGGADLLPEDFPELRSGFRP